MCDEDDYDHDGEFEEAEEQDASLESGDAFKPDEVKLHEASGGGPTKPAKPSGSKEQPLPVPSLDFLGPAPLGQWEDRKVFDRLHAALVAQVSPVDFIETLYVRDAAQKYWDVLRYEKAKAARLEVANQEAIGYFLARGVARTAGASERALPYTAFILAENALNGDTDGVRQYHACLERTGIAEDQLDDLRVMAALDDLERLDRLADNARAGFERLLRQVGQHRASLATRLRSAAAIIDVEFHDQ